VAVSLSRRVRFAALATLFVAGAASVPAIASPSPHLRPDIGQRIDNVQQRLHDLTRHNDQLVERYNQANITYHVRVRAAADASAAAHAAEHRLQVAHDQFSVAAAAQYEGGSFSGTGALLDSNSGSSYLDSLDTMSMLKQHNAQLVNNYAVAQHSAEAAKAKATGLLKQAAQSRARLGHQRDVINRQIDNYTKLLHSLTAKQKAIWEAAQRAREITQRRQAEQLLAAQRAQAQTQTGTHTGGTTTTQTPTPPARTPSAPPASSSVVEKAIAFALAQVGKPYVWGTAGPSTYDCSGLTMASYAAAGVSLPHSAAQQYGYGTHVSFDQLEPGDLMFYYSPIGHVTMYIGGGRMISAPQTGDVVKVIPATDNMSDFVGATRLVG
jgi:cell wall-associated NlpC family hydrolase